MKKNLQLNPSSQSHWAPCDFSSCIGSFSLTNNVLNWNKSATDNKFINELIFIVISSCLCSLLSS